MSNGEGQGKIDREAARVFEEANPNTVGFVSRSDLGELISRREGPRAVMFVPEGVDLEKELAIEVVSINPAAMAAMVARRC
jgi:hypothetical protein